MSTERPRKSELPQFLQDAFTDANSLLFGPDEELIPLCDTCVYNRRQCPNETNMILPVESKIDPSGWKLVDAFEEGIEPGKVFLCESYTPRRVF